jgi:hypothetical protein
MFWGWLGHVIRAKSEEILLSSTSVSIICIYGPIDGHLIPNHLSEKVQPYLEDFWDQFEGFHLCR